MANHAAFFGLLKQLPETTKEEIVRAFSNGRTESLTEFQKRDIRAYNLMILELQKRVQLENDRETKKLRSGNKLDYHRHSCNSWTCTYYFNDTEGSKGKKKACKKDQRGSRHRH